MKELARYWKERKFEGTMLAFWLLTVAFSFWGSSLFSITIPYVGELFPFRVFLPITALLYLIWMLRGNDHIWKDSTKLEKCVYGLIVILLVYGAASIPRAMDLVWTVRKLFNLCLDMCFFFLVLRLCRKPEFRKATMYVCFFSVSIIMVLGIYEVFCGGIFNHNYDDFKRFTWFLSIYQWPTVTYFGTNTYAACLTYFYALFALTSFRQQRPSHKIHMAWTVVTFFLLLATNSRLCIFAFCLLVFAQFCGWFILNKRSALRDLSILLLCFGCICFANQYRYIVPPIQEHRAEMAAYQQGELQEKPLLHQEKPHKESLDEQFFEFDEDGEKVLRETTSAGQRTHLLLHALNCFVESRGLGMGLGNTETLAPQRVAAPNWIGFSQYSIHCFIARLIADYGIFALLPLCIIGVLLLKRWWIAFLAALRRKNTQAVAEQVLYLFVLLIYPVVSCADGDSQDLIAMWIYLASVVLLCAKCGNGKDEIELTKPV